MPAPLFTTNDSDITQLEGLYIKETTPPATVVESSLNTVGIVGETLKGPDTAQLIGSEARFVEVFGAGYLNGVLINKVWKSILNKGFSSMYVQRVRAAAAVKASFTVETAAGGAGTAIARIDASSVGTWGNSLQFKKTAATDANVNHWNLSINDTLTGKVWLYENLDTSTGNNNLATKIGTDAGRPVDVTKLADGVPVTNVAGVDGADSNAYTFLGQTVASFTSVAGTDGSVADSDYTGTGKPLDSMAVFKGVAIVMVAEYTSATVRANTKTLAAASSDRMFLMGPTDETISVAAAVSDVASFHSDRVLYCYNHAYTIDPTSAAEILTRPESWMACVLANTDVDIHPGEQDTKRFLAGITRVYNPNLTRADYIALRAAGISAMEVDLGDPVFVSGMTTDNTPGKTQITRRRMADFLQLSAANTLRFQVKKKITDERKKAIAGLLRGWLSGLKRAGRVVEDYTVDGDILNNPTDLGNGIYRILMRVKIVGHMLHVVLQTEIGTGVTISAQ